jgi:hypothetical protein
MLSLPNTPAAKRSGAFSVPDRRWMLVVATLVGCGGSNAADTSTAGSGGGSGFGGGRDGGEEGSPSGNGGAVVMPTPGQDAEARGESGDVLNPPDANADAPFADAGAVTYVADIQPILRTACNGCHDTDSSAPFVDSYAATQLPSMAQSAYGCPGELVGVCINRAAQGQALEGTRCRTYDRPFHREGFNRCLTEHEQSLIMAWVAGGMIER